MQFRSQAWSFALKRRSRLLEKTKVGLSTLAPSVELYFKRRHCLLEKTKIDLSILGPKRGASLLSVGIVF